MVQNTVGGLDDQTTNEPKKVIEEIKDVAGTVHNEISEDFQKNKETIEKAPELDKENFRIDSTNWKEITDPNGIKVKENPEGDVREYVEGKYKGEQLFTQDSAIREANKAGKILPTSWTTYRYIIEKKYKGNYQDFLKGENMIFAGWRYPDNGVFNHFDEVFALRCADGFSTFEGGTERWGYDLGNENYGFSVRCLKSV